MDLRMLILILAMVAALVGLLVWLLILVFREDEDKVDEPILINFMPNYTSPEKGYAIGMVVNKTLVNNRELIEYQPKDVNVKFLKEKKEIPNSKVVIDKNKLLVLPRGTLSNQRDIFIGLPPHAEDFPANLKKTLFGQALMQLTEEINANNVETMMVREGSTRKTSIIKRIGDGEVSGEYLESYEELVKDLTKHQERDKQTFNRPSFDSQGTHNAP